MYLNTVKNSFAAMKVKKAAHFQFNYSLSAGLLTLGMLVSGAIALMEGTASAATTRFASFNTSISERRNAEGQFVNVLSTPTDRQVQTVTEIIQRVNPDVLLLNEFDFDQNGTATRLFQDNYLSVGQNVLGGTRAAPVTYPYRYVAPTNTGVASRFDLDNNGTVATQPGAPGYGNDAFGFGTFPGQYGMVVYSKYPIMQEDIRTFQTFRWKDMPGALLPDNPATPEPNDWYSPEELDIFRLSSKTHWDVPVNVNGNIVHTLVSHPTPPVFDDPPAFPAGVDFNGRRNYDEIRFWADYITPEKGDYIYDDAGTSGGLKAGSSFVIMGDQNADPLDGDSTNNAIRQLTDSSLINTSVTPASEGGSEQAALDGGVNLRHQGNPAFDTSDFGDTGSGNIRVDYALPSQDLNIVDAAVFWPSRENPLFPLVGDRDLPISQLPSSDHNLVWVDVEPVPEPSSSFGIVGIGSLGMLNWYWRRRKKANRPGNQ